MDFLRGIIGVIVLILIAVLFSSNRRAIDWRIIGVGVIIHFIIGVLTLKVEIFRALFQKIGGIFITVISFSSEGAAFIFNDLTNSQTFGFIFAVKVLPTIIFFSALTSGLFYLGILQKCVFFIALAMKKTFRLTGAESLSAAGNIFLGQTEAPLLIKPYLPDMNRSQLFCVMVGGMATLAGSVLASYVEFLGGNDLAQKQFFATHFLTASLMNAPAAVIFAKILVPQTEQNLIEEKLVMTKDKLGDNIIDALAIGAIDGLKLAAIITGMLIAFISVIHLVNYVLGNFIGANTPLNEWVRISTENQFQSFNLQYILGQICRPVVFLIGAEWKDSLMLGSLLGEKTVTNEFIAYSSLSKVKAQLSEKSTIIAVYSLCSFSNFSSIAIQVGGIGSLAPSQRVALSTLGLKAVLGGTLACLLSATIAAMLS